MTREKVLEIRAEYELAKQDADEFGSGQRVERGTVADLATRYGMSKAGILNIVARRSWKHV